MRTGSGSKDAFGPGNGLSHEFGLAMDDEGVSPVMFKQAVSVRPRKAAVGAALRGELLLPIIVDINDLITREIDLTKQWCGLAEIDYPGDKIVRQVIRDAAKAREGLTENDRFRPSIAADCGLEAAFQFFYGWNEQCDTERQPGLKVKLAAEPGKELWRDKKAERLAIERGVFSAVPLVELANPWDNSGRPYNLPYDAQDEVCREAGGEGLSTVEDLTWLPGRGTLERPGKPCWAPVWFRCKNAYGSVYSLSVCWDADGLCVGYCWFRGFACCSVGAVPRRLHRA
ncbi:MAG: hypothetical protein CEN92_103 [Candidatus Berkelbacteria bacterium Licking1014_96]|uniref:Uncharacterized protein n=1 Tax=Candidatus Berkelbacteria bacterium Licking1014_96 TaxID=2017149 RepID=A0A554LH40_9BACT|nr:MAG: hypothetical protein CEN92_103 [Candidatus Berkelbacteria bacterium Licking1014_96]